MKLYYAPGASSMAVHIVLRELGRSFDLERVDLVTLLTAGGRDYAAINPKARLPALEVDDELFTETPVILEYLADLVPEPQLAPPAGSLARYRLGEYLAFLATEVDARFAQLTEGDVPRDYASRLRGRLGARLGYLATQVADSAFLLGETYTIGDAYAFVLLRWCRPAGIDLKLWPNLDDYFERVLTRPAVIATHDAEGLPIREVFRRSA